MQKVAEGMRTPYDGYLGAVALEMCEDVGEGVWLKREGYSWEGPFLVIDCARPIGVYTNIVEHGVVVELDYETWVRWGRSEWVVTVAKGGPNVTDPPVYIADWFLSLNPFGE
jgi:hypothetical protein